MISIPGDGVWLLAAAAPREADAVLHAFGHASGQAELWKSVRVHPRVELVRTGVGKANAAGAAGSLIDPEIHEGVLSVGIAGVLPRSALEIGDAVCATSSVFSDEGIGTPSGFQAMSSIGFGYFDDGSMSIEHDSDIVDWLGSHCNASAPIACVSWCSGDDRCARAVVERTDAQAEAMEGAACALVAQRLGVRTGELRVISNTTGDRDTQRWDLDGALERLSEVIGRAFVSSA